MRNTRAKQLVIETLSENSAACTHAFVYEQLKNECDRATVYRILERLTEEGVLHKVVNVDGVINYALCQTCENHSKHTHNHVHFSCESCSEVTCIDQIEPQIQLPKKYRIHEVNLTVSGICPNCS